MKKIKKMKIVLLFSVLLCGAYLFQASGALFSIFNGEDEQQPEFIFRYAENQSEKYPTTQAALAFAEMVEEKTGGRIQIEVYYGGELGDEKSVIEQVQFGGIDFTRVSLSSLAEFSTSLNVLQLPYLYQDADHMWRVLDGEIGDMFLESVRDSGMTGLAWFDAGARNFYNSVREIHCIEDMRGLKIRVQESGLMVDMIKALGAVPVPMTYSEVYTGLQTGMIDGAENNWSSYESTKHYQLSRYLVVDEHTRVPEMVLISNVTLQKLSAEDKKIVQECAKQAAVIERKLWAESENRAEKEVVEGGVVVTTLSIEEKQKFQDAMIPLYETYASDDMEIVEQIQSIQ